MSKDDKTNRGEPDRSLVSEDEAYELAYFKKQILTDNPWIHANLTDDDVLEIIRSCMDDIAPSRSREKLTKCVVTKAAGRAAAKVVKARKRGD